MKKWIILLVCACCLSCNVSSQITKQARNNESSTCDSLILQEFAKISDPSQNVNLDVAVADMEQISKMYPDAWLPYYYQAYLGITDCLMNRQSKDAEQKATQYLPVIDNASKQKGADQSEIHALKAYYYYILIALNPQTNGQKYYANVLRECGIAEKFNQENPRAKTIRFVFTQQMGKFMGANKDVNVVKEVNYLKQMFEKEDASSVNPTWGKEVLGFLKY